jgi:hypothetical protein
MNTAELLPPGTPIRLWHSRFVRQFGHATPNPVIVVGADMIGLSYYYQDEPETVSWLPWSRVDEIEVAR